jgi:hypothetical protein
MNMFEYWDTGKSLEWSTLIVVCIFWWNVRIVEFLSGRWSSYNVSVLIFWIYDHELSVLVLGLIYRISMTYLVSGCLLNVLYMFMMMYWLSSLRCQIIRTFLLVVTEMPLICWNMASMHWNSSLMFLNLVSFQ